MKKWYLIAATLLLQIQSVPAIHNKSGNVKVCRKVISFTPPLRIPLILSGSFGELRPSHFHGGIDFKTDGKTGLPVYSIADGYVSKIFVSYGSGYMVHITHPNGYTSIYRHMIGFSPAVMNYTLNYQYRHQTDQCEITLKPNELRVRQGDQIGFSGNEGFSMGPHLHLDLYRTDNGDFVDPTPFFMSHFKDTRKPQATGIRLFPQHGTGIIGGRTDQVSFYPANGKIIKGWGWIGVGVKCHDYQDASYSQHGVRYVSLYVDGKLKCSTNMACFSRTENLMKSAWVEENFEKMYREPGNRMRIMKADPQRGLVFVNQERDYKCQLVLRDLYGNESKYNFVIRGRKQIVPQWKYSGNVLIHWNRINIISRPGVQVIIPKLMVPNDLSIHLQVHASTGLSDVYQLDNQPTLLLGSCELQIRLKHPVPQGDERKLYIASQSPMGWKSCGGIYRNGFVITKIEKLGTYKLMIDNTPPKISVLSMGAGSRLAFIVGDSGSGLRSYRGFVDGKFVLLHLRRQSNKMEYKLSEAQVKRGGIHKFELIAVDNVGNVSTYKNSFRW